MPLSKYYGGHGEEVMASMSKKHGKKKGKEIFYATANKHGLDAGPSKKVKKEHGV
jgi:hypothetical protein